MLLARLLLSDRCNTCCGIRSWKSCEGEIPMRHTTLLLLLLISTVLVGLSGCVSDTSPPQMVTRETTVIRETIPLSPSSEAIVRQPPPPPREEPRGVAPAAAYVWIPGHWTWDNNWVWTPGHWELPPSRTTVWIPGQWVHTDRGWVWQSGRWQ
jgi:hypothetical protein